MKALTFATEIFCVVMLAVLTMLLLFMDPAAAEKGYPVSGKLPGIHEAEFYHGKLYLDVDAPGIHEFGQERDYRFIIQIGAFRGFDTDKNCHFDVKDDVVDTIICDLPWTLSINRCYNIRLLTNTRRTTRRAIRKPFAHQSDKITACNFADHY